MPASIDPQATLLRQIQIARNIRGLISRAIEVRGAGGEAEVVKSAVRDRDDMIAEIVLMSWDLVALILALDEHLIRGGDLPLRWKLMH